MEASARRSRITPEREAELYETVLDLLREVGYAALTMDAIAARTRSSKATLYRQWGGKSELVVRVMRHGKPTALQPVDTGSLRGDLHALIRQTDDGQLARDSALMRSIGHEVCANPELLQALRELLIDPEMQGVAVLLQRATARGEVPADSPALEYVPLMLIGAFTARPLMDDAPMTCAFLERYVDAVVLPALGL
ncbi:TetR/AcrR family transcriptional regulator [Streptomyces sparsus]